MNLPTRPPGCLTLEDLQSRVAEGTIDTVLGDGTRGDGPEPDPRRCRLNRPHGVFVDAEGGVYVGDSEAHRIRRLH